MLDIPLEYAYTPWSGVSPMLGQVGLASTMGAKEILTRVFTPCFEIYTFYTKSFVFYTRNIYILNTFMNFPVIITTLMK